MQIPLCDPKLEYLANKEEFDVAIQGVLEAGHYILGPNVKSFEDEVASYLGCASAVGVNSGTDALHIALRALGIGPGDEVITTPFTFIATTEAIGMVGVTPVFADINPRTFNLDPNCIADAITPRTKAILPVHLYGLPCDMDAIMDISRQHDLRVIEDCAQAIGASYRGKKVGTIGDVGCFSFFPSKNLGCFGDGGLVTTNDSATYERVEMLRRHGGKKKYHHSELGLNSRLDELQAAILRIKMRQLDARNRQRCQVAEAYSVRFDGLSNVVCPIELIDADNSNDCDAVYNQYTIQTTDRDKVTSALKTAGVGCAIYYPLPLHLQSVHSDLGYREGDFPISEAVAQRCLSLPMFPELSGTQLENVAQVLEGFFDPSRVAA